MANQLNYKKSLNSNPGRRKGDTAESTRLWVLALVREYLNKIGNYKN